MGGMDPAAMEKAARQMGMGGGDLPGLGGMGDLSGLGKKK